MSQPHALQRRCWARAREGVCLMGGAASYVLGGRACLRSLARSARRGACLWPPVALGAAGAPRGGGRGTSRAGMPAAAAVALAAPAPARSRPSFSSRAAARAPAARRALAARRACARCAAEQPLAVAIPRPLGLSLGSATGDRGVVVEGVVEGSNAAREGTLRAGDVLTGRRVGGGTSPCARCRRRWPRRTAGCCAGVRACTRNAAFGLGACVAHAWAGWAGVRACTRES